MLVECQFKSFQRQPYINAFFLLYSRYGFHRQVMRCNSFGHEDIIENPVVKKLFAFLACFGGIEPSPEKMRIHNLDETFRLAFFNSHLFAYKLTQACNAK